MNIFSMLTGQALSESCCYYSVAIATASPLSDCAALASPCVSSAKQYEERFLREETVSQQISSIQLLQTNPLAPPEVVTPQRPSHRQVHLRGHPASKPTVIRGITYYKAKVPDEENDIEEPRELGPCRTGKEMPCGPGAAMSSLQLAESPWAGHLASLD